MSEERRVEPRYIEDVLYYKEKLDETKPRMDETRVSRKGVETAKITVTRTDATRPEEIERPKYPREQEVGRIVIEEVPEEKEERPRDIYRKYVEKPRTTEVTVTREDVSDVCKPYEKEDVVKVGKLDVHELDKTPMESRRVEERSPIRSERVDRPRKVG